MPAWRNLKKNYDRFDVMNPEDPSYEALQRLFLSAAEIDSTGERVAYLEKACGQNDALRKAIDALLQEYDARGAGGPDLIAQALDEQGIRVRDEALFLPGTVLAERYRIVTLLGKGGMGEVYRADDLRLDQPVALKFLPAALAKNQALLRALTNEVRHARRVSHRHVGRVHDIGEIDGHHFLSMEYIEGEDLAASLRRIGQLPLPKAVQLGCQLCAGVQAGHAEGVLHLDLKPANLMIDQDGDLRITDFGLARLAGDARTNRRLAGTPVYMAPEQLLHCEVSEASDIFAVGLILLEMLTGKRLCPAGNLEEVVAFHEGDSSLKEAVSIALRGIDSSMGKLIGRCLEREPGDRPLTIGKVLDQLALKAATAPLSVEDLKESDVFIAYASIDDQPLSTDSQGWISQFQRNLEVRLQQLSGEPVKVWRDSAEPDESRVEEIVSHLADVKAMVSVVSPPFVKSSPCLREVEAFHRTLAVEPLAGPQRLLKAVKTPVDSMQVPSALASLMGYDFYEIDEETGRVIEYDESFGPRAKQQYFERLYDLAQEVSQVIQSSEEGRDEGNGRTVYLGSTTSDQMANRDRIKRELITRGHTVLPDTPLSMVASKLRQEVAALLARCDFAIHPVGSHYGIIPEGADCSVAEIENELAAEASDGGLARAIWIPRGMTPVEERQKSFTDALRKESRYHRGAEIVCDTLENLKTFLVEKLTEKEEASSDDVPEEEGVVAPRIYLICDGQDQEAIETLEDYLFEQGVDISLHDFEAEEREASETHRDNLRDCDGVLIYYGVARHAWVDIKLRGLMKASGYGRKTPLTNKLVYVAPPFDRRKERFRSHQAQIVHQEGETFAPHAELERFVKGIQPGKESGA